MAQKADLFARSPRASSPSRSSALYVSTWTAGSLAAPWAGTMLIGEEFGVPDDELMNVLDNESPDEPLRECRHLALAEWKSISDPLPSRNGWTAKGLRVVTPFGRALLELWRKWSASLAIADF